MRGKFSLSPPLRFKFKGMKSPNIQSKISMFFVGLRNSNIFGFHLILAHHWYMSLTDSCEKHSHFAQGRLQSKLLFRVRPKSMLKINHQIRGILKC